jgi:hypothetical protein
VISENIVLLAELFVTGDFVATFMKVYVFEHLFLTKGGVPGRNVE